MGRRSVSEGPRREQTDFPVHRLLDVSLVPRDGARVVRERRRGVGAQRVVRANQGRPRGAARRGSRVHDVRAGHDRLGRLADERVAHARSQAVLRRDVLSAVIPLGPSRLRRHPRRDRARVGRRSEEAAAVGRGADGTVARHRACDAGQRRADGGCARPHRVAIPRHVRSGARRIRRRTEVSASLRAAVSPSRARPDGQRRRAQHGARDAARDGERRHARSRGRRVSPLLGRRGVAGAALREDALRPGAARGRPARSVAGLRRSVFCRRGRGHAPVRHAPDDRRGGRLLFRRGRRQRAAGTRG